MIDALLRRIVPLREGEARPVLLAAAHGFAILFAYYVLRPVRDEISAADRGNLQLLWTAVFFVMLLAVPLYSAAVARWPRRVFVPLANRFFAANGVLFFAALVLLPESARVWIDRVFYVWVSVFALFVVTVFWGFVADLFRDEQARRLFGFIAVGASLGGVAGAGATALLAGALPVSALLLLAVLPLEVAARLAVALDRQAAAPATALRAEPGAPVGGSVWSGMAMAWRSRELRRIAAWLLLMTFASTVLYFVQAQVVGEAYADRAARRGLLARIDLAVNVLTIFTQAFLTARLLRRLGMALTLALLPAVALVGFAALGSIGTTVVLVILRVVYDSTRHALAKPAREVLFTRVDREARYKAKAFIDAAVYRGGDLASGWLYAGLALLGLSAGGIALAAVPVVALWLALGWSIGGAAARPLGEGEPPLEAAGGRPESP